MPWDAFCDEHYEQAMEDVAKKWKDHDVGYTEHQPENILERLLCGYPDCLNKATKEVIWLDKNIGDKPSSEYVGLEDLD